MDNTIIGVIRAHNDIIVYSVNGYFNKCVIIMWAHEQYWKMFTFCSGKVLEFHPYETGGTLYKDGTTTTK